MFIMNRIFTSILVLIMLFIINIDGVFAECTYTEKANLNKIAANVKVDYEIKKDEEISNDDLSETGETVLVINRSINLNVYNLSKELYLEQTDTSINETKTFYYDNSNSGLITTNYTDLSMIRKFTFKIYASDNTACPGEVLKTLYLTMPKYNEYYDMCENIKDFSLCKEFITVDIKDLETFYKKYEEYRMENDELSDDKIIENDKWYDKVIDFLNEYKFYFIGGTIIIGGIFTIVIVKKIKRQRELGL